MRVVIQRVTHASVTVEGNVIGQIENGYMLLVGITHSDTPETVHMVAKKCIDLRINDDENGKMNLSLKDINGSILSISQFTLYADYRKGRRPGFDKAAKPEQAIALYELFNQELKDFGIHVETGKFAAEMSCELCNQGPITILLDSDELA